LKRAEAGSRGPATDGWQQSATNGGRQQKRVQSAGELDGILHKRGGSVSKNRLQRTEGGPIKTGKNI